MAIKQLKIENFMKIEALDITPPEDIVILEGKNGAGKTSVHIGILSALLGGRSIPDDPIKHGHDHAMVEVDLGEQVVNLKITTKGTYLKVKDKATGKEIGSPQKWLDERIGKIAFDPVAFLDEDPKKQRQIILDLVGINTDKLDSRYKEVFEERTIIGRDVKRAEAEAQSATFHPDKLPDGEVNIGGMAGHLQKIMDERSNVLRSTSRRDQLQNELARIHKELDEVAESMKGMTDVVKLDESIAALNDEISKVDETNAKVRDNRRALEIGLNLEATQNQYTAKSNQLEAITKAKKNLLKSAKLPIEGLEIADDCIKYNGNTIAQISEGEGYMVGAAIAKALNPICKIMRIRKWADLDPDNQAIIRKMAKDEGYQIWTEIVTGAQNQGIYIEDGKVR